MTAHQQSQLNKLATEYRSTTPRDANDGTDSVLVDCWEVSLPELCVVCGREDVEHLNIVSNGSVPAGLEARGHAFRVAVPAASFRVSPSGFVQNVSPVAA
jgi:hypothetical protein